MTRKQLATALTVATAVAIGYVIGATAATAHSAPAQPAQQQISPAQEVWLDALEWQESSASTTIVNPRDSDGTPSYGCLQFKPGTFAEFAKKYGVAGALMDCGAQRAIVSRMIESGNVDLSRQFPGSVRRLGLPPTN